MHRAVAARRGTARLTAAHGAERAARATLRRRRRGARVDDGRRRRREQGGRVSAFAPSAGVQLTN